jgi:archaellum biogenesis protein FlaJ (TadC family)
VKPYLLSLVRLHVKHRDSFTFALVSILYQLNGYAQVCFICLSILDSFSKFISSYSYSHTAHESYKF